MSKGSNRLKIALRQAANAVGNLKDTALSNFFKRIAFRKGRTSAISATARKLAVIIWNMVTKKVSYKTDSQYEFLDQKRKRKVMEMKKLIHKFDITPDDLGLQLNINNLIFADYLAWRVSDFRRLRQVKETVLLKKWVKTLNFRLLLIFINLITK